MVGAQVRLHRKLKRWRGKTPTPLTIFNLNCMPQFNNFYLNLNYLNSGIASLCWPLKNKNQLLKYLKCKVLFLFLIILPLFTQSQNLVPNWSFEEYDECPDGTSQIHFSSGWISFRLTPDYFNACNQEMVGVPSNVFSQNAPAIQGVAYGGFGRNHNNGNSEVLAIQLTEQLVIGTEYYVSFYLRRPNYNNNCWNNNIGATFTGVMYQDWPMTVALPLNNYAHVLYADMIEEPNVWIKVEGAFIADSSYSYLAIGYHFDGDHMDVECEIAQVPMQTYFFVDCVCVSIDPDMCPVCETTTQIVSDRSSPIEIDAFPNPFIDNCQIILPANINGKVHLQLYNSSGILIKQWFEASRQIIVISQDIIKAKGLYILEVGFESGEKSQIKLLKM